MVSANFPRCGVNHVGDFFVMVVHGNVSCALNVCVMKIKGMDGHESSVTGQGQGNLNTVLGAVGTAGALGILNGNGLLGGLFGGCGNTWNRGGCCESDMPITRYEANMMNLLAAKDSRIGLLESNIYTDQKIADVYERLNVKINANKDAQDAINLQQAVYNGTNTAALSCLQGQVAQLYSLTKLVVPNTSVCPGWGNVTIAPATTPATV